jgi:hypothetical protein
LDSIASFPDKDGDSCQEPGGMYVIVLTCQTISKRQVNPMM